MKRSRSGSGPGKAWLVLCLLAVLIGGSAWGESRFRFREPEWREYRISDREVRLQGMEKQGGWIAAWPERGGGLPVELGSRLVLEVEPGVTVERLVEGRPVKVARHLRDTLVILEAPTARSAATVAEELSREPGVLVCHPVARRPAALHNRYAPAPADPYFDRQVNLENRDSRGNRQGIDLNVRAAWPHARGRGVMIAIVDDGVEVGHPDLREATAEGAHFDFTSELGATDTPPVNGSHGTAVAGLVAARGGNREGMSGVAPEAGLSSWVVFDAANFGDLIQDEEVLMDMFQYANDTVWVQNHSWGSAIPSLVGPSRLEDEGIAHAVESGRFGRGVVIVRSAGNNRIPNAALLHPGLGNVNDDGYPNDPRVIAVAAAGLHGRATSYSNPGACLLVAAPSGDRFGLQATPNLFTTDLQGSEGANSFEDPVDYRFDSATNPTGFSGTSAASPQIAGIAALVLSINPLLTYRDVQQILLHAARHFDLDDPDLRRNGAGFWVSHNVGFGIPDAGEAVRLARDWPSRPPQVEHRYTTTEKKAIPDDGYRLEVTGDGVPAALRSVSCLPSLGPHQDDPMSFRRLQFVGVATNDISLDLRGAGALIQRGPAGEFPDDRNTFRRKIERAAEAGAEFAVIYNNRDGEERLLMAETDYVPIPAVFIGQFDGEDLANVVTNNTSARARLHLESAKYVFQVNHSLSCEHIGVRVQSDHPRRGDLRITLVSPAGTRSVLQHYNNDDSAGPVDWTYWSTQHFYETSFGVWTVSISDEDPTLTGDVNQVELILQGVSLQDEDHDGLEDAWEKRYFGTLAPTPAGDPDLDGFSNARELISGDNPTVANPLFQLDLSPWSEEYWRLSWPGRADRQYEIRAGNLLTESLAPLAVVPGEFPQTEWFISMEKLNRQFFQVKAIPDGGE